MKANELEKMLRNAYSRARKKHTPHPTPHADDQGERNKALSKAWVEELTGHLKELEESRRTPSEKHEVRGFCRSVSTNRKSFGLNELLHDVCIASIHPVPAPVHNTKLHPVIRVYWQVESEFSSNGREVVKDFSKLVAGSAENKLFVGPYRADSTKADRAFEAYRETLAEILRLVDLRTEDNWYLAQVPHPAVWKCFDEDKVSCWKFWHEAMKWVN